MVTTKKIVMEYIQNAMIKEFSFTTKKSLKKNDKKVENKRQNL